MKLAIKLRSHGSRPRGPNTSVSAGLAVFVKTEVGREGCWFSFVSLN